MARAQLPTLALCCALGCGAADPGRSTPGHAPPSQADTGWQPPQGQPLDPDWDSEAALAALEQAVAAGVPEPTSAIDAYLGLMAHGDPVCPGDAHSIPDRNLAGCQTAEGWRFAGVSEYIEGERGVGPGGAVQQRIRGLVGDFEIESPEGLRFAGGGHALLLENTGQHRVQVQGELTGTWAWAGGEGWLAEGTSGYYTATRMDQGGQTQLRLDGAVQMAGQALWFDQLQASPACPSTPHGALGIRDPSGGWHRLWLPDDCTGCGEIWFGDRPTQPACPDLSGLASGVLSALVLP